MGMGELREVGAEEERWEGRATKGGEGRRKRGEGLKRMAYET